MTGLLSQARSPPSELYQDLHQAPTKGG